MCVHWAVAGDAALPFEPLAASAQILPPVVRTSSAAADNKLYVRNTDMRVCTDLRP